MTLKPVEEWIHIWADDWHDTRRLIEAVRSELALEVLAVAQTVTDSQNPHHPERQLGGRDVYYAIDGIVHAIEAFAIKDSK